MSIGLARLLGVDPNKPFTREEVDRANEGPVVLDEAMIRLFYPERRLNPAAEARGDATARQMTAAHDERAAMAEQHWAALLEGLPAELCARLDAAQRAVDQVLVELSRTRHQRAQAGPSSPRELAAWRADLDQRLDYLPRLRAERQAVYDALVAEALDLLRDAAKDRQTVAAQAFRAAQQREKELIAEAKRQRILRQQRAAAAALVVAELAKMDVLALRRRLRKETV